MKRNLKNILTIVGFASIILVSIQLFFLNNFSIGLEGEFIKSIDWVEISESFDSIILEGHYKESITKLKLFRDMDKKRSDIYISDRLAMIDSLYKSISSPYPGVLSNRIECPEEFKPKKVENDKINYSIVYSSDRFTYGVCSKDLIKYKTIIYFLYCDEQNILYHINLFIPFDKDISSYEKTLESIRCLE